MRILFWGTPEFALPSLRALTEEGHAVLAVVTQPDRPAGRGRVVRPGPVKRAATAEGIPVLQPVKPRGDEFVECIRALEPDLSVVAAYGHLLPEEVLHLPRLGSLNVHASLLPKLRGAAPINWTIIRGHERTGVSIMRMVAEMDAGPVLHQMAIGLGPDVTAGELSQMLAELGATALIEVLTMLESGAPTEVEQDHARATFAPKLTRETARLDWTLPATELSRWIRGCDPWPGGWSSLGGRPVQLFQPSVDAAGDTGSEGPPGTVVWADPREGVAVRTGQDLIRIGEVKPAGRARMSAAAWVRGRGVQTGDRFV
ncbi:MAG: methionyl-tRNA formyltransferase [Gemmatimonadota bacterium]